MTHPLDNPVLASFTGPHSGLALTRGRAARYPADVSPFCALPGEPDAADWADAAGLLNPNSASATAATSSSRCCGTADEPARAADGRRVRASFPG